jgi:hypothetical protein
MMKMVFDTRMIDADWWAEMAKWRADRKKSSRRGSIVTPSEASCKPFFHFLRKITSMKKCQMGCPALGIWVGFYFFETARTAW